MDNQPLHWALKSNGSSLPRCLAISPDGRAQIITATAWPVPFFSKTILVLDGVPIPVTQFDMRSGFPTVTRFDEETQTWHGTCCDGYRKRCRWSISLADQTLSLVEDPDV